MGLDWFELDVDMPDDPKCVALGARLKNPLAFGYVVRLYAYCYRHGVDRFSGPGAVETIESAARWKGKDGGLVSALEAERFLDREAEFLVVHGIGKRLGPTLAKLERDADRQRVRREDFRRQMRGRPQDVSATSSGQTSDVQGDPTRPDPTRPDHATVTDHDTTIRSQSGTTVERLRVAVSQRLGIIGANGQGMPPCSSTRLGQVVRDSVAAVERRTFEAVVEALVADAEARKAAGRAVETFGGFAHTLASLARDDAPLPEQKRNGEARPVTAPASPPAAFAKGGRIAL